MRTSPALRLSGAIAVLVALAACAPLQPAVEAPRPVAPQITEDTLRVRAEEQLSAGIKHYDAGEFDAAARSFQASLDHGLLDKVDQSRARKYLAFIHCVGGREPQCAAEFRRAFKARFNEEPETYAAHAYDGMNMIIWAIQAAGLNRAKIRDVIAHLPHPWPGVTGDIVFSAALDDVGAGPGELVMLSQGPSARQTERSVLIRFVDMVKIPSFLIFTVPLGRCQFLQQPRVSIVFHQSAIDGRGHPRMPLFQIQVGQRFGVERNPPHRGSRFGGR